MKFICVQIYLEKKIQNLDSQTNVWAEIIRVVEAETEEEAIGKFIIQTRYVKAVEKLGVTCYRLEWIKTID